MRRLGTSWGAIWRMAYVNLLAGAVLGFLYGPVAQLILVVLDARYHTAKDGSGGSYADPGTLFVALIVAGVVGLSLGAFIGFIGGILAGIAASLVFARGPGRLPDGQFQYGLLYAMSAAAGGLVTLALTTLSNLPSRLSYLGGDWVRIGWFLFVAIPVILFSAIFWRSSSHVIRGAADRKRASS